MTPEQFQTVLRGHIPAQAVQYCLHLRDVQPFRFKLSKTRHTKVGDFSSARGQVPLITVNEDLNQYQFLITYIHEVAHLHVHDEFGSRAGSHGAEWKTIFRKLLNPVMRPDIFPEALLGGLARHMMDPKASTFSDPAFTRLMRQHDPRWITAVIVSDISEGSLFNVRGRWFRKGKLLRTRVQCMEVKTRRKFLVPADMQVESGQLRLL